MGKSTISMAMFQFANCKRLPEGKAKFFGWNQYFGCLGFLTNPDDGIFLYYGWWWQLQIIDDVKI